MKLLPIVFTCDDHYFKYASVVICSIIKNSDRNTKYEINILSEFISDENRALANKMIHSFSNFSISYHILKIENPEEYHLNSYMSLSTYYRFFIFDLLKNYERVLYLDSDLIVDNDISFYADIDFENKAAISSLSIYVQNLLIKNIKHDFTRDYFLNVLLMKDYNEYFNAGVILFNIKLIREQNIDQKFFDAIKAIKNPIFQDQDILNSVLSNNGGVKLISKEYNFTSGMKLTMPRLLVNAISYQLGNKKRNKWFTIYHYVGKIKPWQQYNSDSSLFFYYAYKTLFIKDILQSNKIVFKNSQKIKLWLISKF
ncbi:glycosyltransferase family 8 protein [Kaistella flava (ex Peng et al. 2021)]|uniref:Glycosyltransferase family 8 protein n=1 Tax=Kaistella flava (ex Peng et al. 2021) TaxID=2038776 RepID=A0A7M2Y9E5_9FLAO|nr:glycosyltransferase family 8 protein [Kaistella flava (ex Peng et al. 2021)]QOW10888.1 glycosyltransferase family 8 protein [Kaistella flava (ex Peng et al. 2021)]